jgi:hypothetical protein
MERVQQMQPKREVINHTFISSYPQVAVKIDQNFVYKGEEAKNDFLLYDRGGESGSNFKRENYCFINASEKQAFSICFTTMVKGYWRPNLNLGIPHLLISGNETLAGDSYQTAVWAYQQPSGRCLLMKRLGRFVGAKGNCVFKIIFSQEIKPELGPCSRWQDASMLNSEQRAFLESFLKSAERDMEIVKYREVAGK